MITRITNHTVSKSINDGIATSVDVGRVRFWFRSKETVKVAADALAKATDIDYTPESLQHANGTMLRNTPDIRLTYNEKYPTNEHF